VVPGLEKSGRPVWCCVLHVAHTQSTCDITSNVTGRHQGPKRN